MKYLYTFLFLLLLTPSFSQIEFAPIGASWYHTYISKDFTGTVKWNGYHQMHYDRDTVIEGIDCKVLSVVQVGSIGGEIRTFQKPDHWIYQEGSKVYHYLHNGFKMLYDFGVEQGDTIHYIDPVFCDWVVDSVYVDTIHGEPIKHILVNEIDYAVAFDWLYNEKMGMMNYGFFDFPFGCAPDYFTSGPLRCYHDNQFPLHQLGTVTCDSYEDVSSLRKPAELGLSIYPNPSNDLLQIKNTALQAYDVTVYDISGRISYQSQRERGAYKKINVRQWQAGTYFLLIQSEEGWAVQQIVVGE